MTAHGRLLSVALLALLAACSSSPHADFGETPRLSADEPIPVAQVLEEPDRYQGQYLRVAGEVVGVCAKKGCWLRMAPAKTEDPAESIFVKFTCPVEGRLIPMEAVGHRAIVEGTLEVEVVSESDARHLAEDAGKSPEEIATIVGEQKQLRLAAPAARVIGITAPVVAESPGMSTSQPASS